MLWDVSALDGYTIEAGGGRIGSVSDFLFEETGIPPRRSMARMMNHSGRTTVSDGLRPEDGYVSQPCSAREGTPGLLNLEHLAGDVKRTNV